MSLFQQYPVEVAETSCTRSIKKLIGSHRFKIMGYSLEKDIGKGGFLESTIFSVGGHDWCFKYFPTGSKAAEEGYASIFVYLRTSNADCVKAEVCFGILDQSGSALPISQKLEVRNFKEINSNWGLSSFAKRAELEPYIKDDCLILHCTVTVFKVFPVGPTESIVVPPGNIQSQLGHLLETGNGADITFEVNGMKFSAHRCMLAARSPVFSAQFFGPMKEKLDTTIKIEEMEAPIFKSLLHFIYSDSVPEFSEAKEGEEEQGTHLQAQQLLIAADRYNLERLKMICQRMLYNTIDKSNVVSLLFLADRHSCIHLRKGCLQYLVSADMLGEVIQAEEFQQLIKNDPLILKELLGK